MTPRKVFQDSITPLPTQPGITAHGLMVNAAKPKNDNQVLPILFSLSMPAAAEADLEQKVAQGQVVSPDALKSKYVPNKKDIDGFVGWLKEEGFEITSISPNGTAVYAQAPISLIEKSLQVNMTTVTSDGVTYPAAENAPSLPGEVAGPVHAIIGLQPFRHANKHRKLPQSFSRPARDNGTIAARTQVQAAAVEPPYLVSQICKAYNADGLGLTGAGQTIAILIDTFPEDNDLQQFWQVNNVAGKIGNIKKINVNNVSLPPMEGEETLDAEWTSGVAPGSEIRIYASGSLSLVDISKTLDAILTDAQAIPSLRQLSISLGLGERFYGGPNGEAATQHQKFLRLASLGVNVFVSSGDAGSNPDSNGKTGGPLQVEYASSDSAVVGVGGTTLVLGADGSVLSETGWSAGGGGKSGFFNRPVWQKGPGVPAGQNRLVPDVSLTADPNDGALVIFQGQAIPVGGTSWSAPVWAGFCALMNEARAKAGKPALPFLNPLLYPLLGTTAFRDIQSGSNGAFDAGPGYDMVTGIGVPNIANLIAALMNH